MSGYIIKAAEDTGVLLQENSEMLKEVAANNTTIMEHVSAQAGHVAEAAAAASGAHDFFLIGLMVFMLAVFVGYHVVWSVTPALHSPLMAVTNAVSSVIIVGAVIATGAAGEGMMMSKIFGFLAVTLASVNIFGGFLVTRRMLSMFKKKGG